MKQFLFADGLLVLLSLILVSFNLNSNNDDVVDLGLSVKWSVLYRM